MIKQCGILFVVQKTKNGRIKIDKNTGKIKIKRGTRKGKYNIKVAVKASGDKNYNSTLKTTTVRIWIR